MPGPQCQGGQEAAATGYTWSVESREPADARAASTAEELIALIRRQRAGDDHDRGLIIERLAWTPEQRLEANAEFLRFYLTMRPGGPLVGRE